MLKLLQNIFEISSVKQVISPRHSRGDEDLYSTWILDFLNKTINKINSTDTIYVLDVGGSDGQFSLRISEGIAAKNVHLINIDIDLIALKFAKERNHNLDCILSDASLLPFKTGSIDFIYSISLIEHIKEIDRGIFEQCRVANKAIIFQIPNLRYFVELHTFIPLLGFMPYVLRDRVWTLCVGNAPINWKVSFKKLLVLFGNNEFNLVYVKKLYPLRVLSWLFHPVGHLAVFQQNQDRDIESSIKFN